MAWSAPIAGWWAALPTGARVAVVAVTLALVLALLGLATKTPEYGLAGGARAQAAAVEMVTRAATEPPGSDASSAYLAAALMLGDEATLAKHTGLDIAALRAARTERAH